MKGSVATWCKARRTQASRQLGDVHLDTFPGSTDATPLDSMDTAVLGSLDAGEYRGKDPEGGWPRPRIEKGDYIVASQPRRLRWRRDAAGQNQLPRMLEQVEEWLRKFKGAGGGTANPDMRKIKQLRVDIWKQTREWTDTQAGVHPIFRDSLGQLVLEESPITRKVSCRHRGKLVFKEDPTVKKVSRRQPEVRVESTDILEVAERLIDECSGPVAVLNMACASHPGGGVQSGAGAQEENLHRRTDLWRFLKPNRRRFYPLGKSCLLSKKVTVFRGSEAKGYPLLDKPFHIYVISSAACSHPKLTQNNTYLYHGQKEAMKVRIELIVAAARESECKSLLLSAYGCGAFGHPPDIVAQLFKEVLEGSGCSMLEKVVFCILNDHNSGKKHNPRGNFLPFEEAFRTAGLASGSGLPSAPRSGKDDSGSKGGMRSGSGDKNSGSSWQDKTDVGSSWQGGSGAGQSSWQDSGSYSKKSYDYGSSGGGDKGGGSARDSSWKDQGSTYDKGSYDKGSCDESDFSKGYDRSQPSMAHLAELSSAPQVESAQASSGAPVSGGAAASRGAPHWDSWAEDCDGGVSPTSPVDPPSSPLPESISHTLQMLSDSYHGQVYTQLKRCIQREKSRVAHHQPAPPHRRVVDDDDL